MLVHEAKQPRQIAGHCWSVATISVSSCQWCGAAGCVDSDSVHSDDAHRSRVFLTVLVLDGHHVFIAVPDRSDDAYWRWYLSRALTRFIVLLCLTPFAASARRHVPAVGLHSLQFVPQASTTLCLCLGSWVIAVNLRPKNRKNTKNKNEKMNDLGF